MKEIFFVYCDGASRGNPGSASSAYLIFDANKHLVAKGGKYLGKGTNNEAEYTAVILALKKLKELGAKKAIFYLDSLFVVKQLTGKFKVKEPRMQKLNLAIKRLLWETNMQVEFYYVPRERNKLADQLANEILDRQAKNHNGTPEHSSRRRKNS